MDTVDKLTPESGFLGQLNDDLTPESMKTTGFGRDYEAEGQALKAEEAQSAAAKKMEEERRKRNSMFQTAGGSSGDPVMSVGARETYFGN